MIYDVFYNYKFTKKKNFFNKINNLHFIYSYTKNNNN